MVGTQVGGGHRSCRALQCRFSLPREGCEPRVPSTLFRCCCLGGRRHPRARRSWGCRSRAGRALAPSWLAAPRRLFPSAPGLRATRRRLSLAMRNATRRSVCDPTCPATPRALASRRRVKVNGTTANRCAPRQLSARTSSRPTTWWRAAAARSRRRRTHRRRPPGRGTAPRSASRQR